MTFTEVSVPGPAGPLLVGHHPGEAPASASAAAPVIFIHPVNTSGAVWREVVARLGAATEHADGNGPGFGPLLVPDLRGHGRSTMGGPFQARDYAADVLAVLDHFRLERAHLVGGSIGGPVGVLLAATVPHRVLSLASFGGALELRMGAEEIAAVDALLSRGVDALFAQLLPAALGSRYRTPGLVARAVRIASGDGRPPAVVREVITSAFDTDVSGYAARVRVPSLVVNGSQDGAAPPEAGRRMAEALGGEPVVLDGVGHLPMLEVPATVGSLLANHLRSAALHASTRGPE